MVTTAQPLMVIVPEDSRLEVDGKQTRLQPGMTVSAEIGTGRRRIADCLLSSLSRSAQEAMHER